MRWVRYALIPSILLTLGNLAYQGIKVALGHEADWEFAGAVSFHQVLAVNLLVLIQHIDRSRDKGKD